MEKDEAFIQLTKRSSKRSIEKRKLYRIRDEKIKQAEKEIKDDIKKIDQEDKADFEDFYAKYKE